MTATGPTSARPGVLPVSGPAVDVRVLGRVEVRADGRLTPQQQSLIAFLCLNPAASRAAIVEALWNGRAISDSRFLNVVAETRAAVGSDRLPHCVDGRYRVTGFVLDADLLTAANAEALRARQEGDDRREAEALTRSLAMIDDEVMTSPGGRYWTWLDDAYDLMARLDSVIIAITERLMELVMDNPEFGDEATAEWACLQCLTALPHRHEAVDALLAIYRGSGRQHAVAALERRRTRLD